MSRRQRAAGALLLGLAYGVWFGFYLFATARAAWGY